MAFPGGSRPADATPDFPDSRRVPAQNRALLRDKTQVVEGDSNAFRVFLPAFFCQKLFVQGFRPRMIP